MKLKKANQNINLEEKYQEFDIWITPNLTEIKDTTKFHQELTGIKNLLEILGPKTQNFSDFNKINTHDIVVAILDEANKTKSKERKSIIRLSIALLFLVTGKSDNKAKCQFPLFLRDVSRKQSFPSIQKVKGKPSLVPKDIPREIKSTRISNIVASLKEYPSAQKALFLEYVNFILNEETYRNSFWAIGNSYFKLKEIGKEDDFLLPLIVFKVRGSVSASGGHEPETLLRGLLFSWGMEPDSDYNMVDVVIGKEAADGKKEKTRAYDFILPYLPTFKGNRLYIQCQFYAGDSGSVSHKNIDQTRASRNFTKSQNKDCVFLEYLDGAGYFSSLNGDLKSLLSMDDTYDFFQIRTAPIKLRRALQEIEFLTSLDFVHALVLSENNINLTKKNLMSEGYSSETIERVSKQSIEKKIIENNHGNYSINSDFYHLARKYFLLDVIFNNSEKLTEGSKNVGMILVPGLNGLSGMKISLIPNKLSDLDCSFSRSLMESEVLLKDLEFLSERGWIINI